MRDLVAQALQRVGLLEAVDAALHRRAPNEEALGRRAPDAWSSRAGAHCNRYGSAQSRPVPGSADGGARSRRERRWACERGALLRMVS